jgi:predicted ABC-type exoprotein transport system permease subunit
MEFYLPSAVLILAPLENKFKKHIFILLVHYQHDRNSASYQMILKDLLSVIYGLTSVLQLFVGGKNEKQAPRSP